MRIVIDIDERSHCTSKVADLYFTVNVTKMGHKAEVIHELEGIPPRREIRQILAAVLYGY